MSLFVEDEIVDTRSNHSLWVEKYRPQKLDEYVGSEILKSSLRSYIKNNDIPNILLYSNSPGTGKCLDFSELIDVEIELSDDEALLLKNFIKN